MADQVVLSGKTYVSSKRAAELSQYSRDYIGQLARGGLIEAKRIGGLWYIDRDSLDSYSASPDTYRSPQTQSLVQNEEEEFEATVTFDGKDFISAPRAAKLTGYHQDYIGQLARTGKIPSRQIGNRWYVDRVALQQHKEQKDQLLAAVQTEAVGLQRPVEAGRDNLEPLHFTYVGSQLADPMPVPRKSYSHEPIADRYATIAASDGYDAPGTHTLPIRRNAQSRSSVRKRKSRKAPFGVAVGLLTFVIIVGVAFASLKGESHYATSVKNHLQQTASINVATKSLADLAQLLERVFGSEQVYIRS